MFEPSKVRRQRKYSEISALEYPKNSQVSSSEGGERVPNEGIEESFGLVGWASRMRGLVGYSRSESRISGWKKSRESQPWTPKEIYGGKGNPDQLGDK